ncbi:GyrI-like domain-containing protein [Rhizobium leguminosarum]|uniref:GyrI-like domain-containing protein n=1 Tax=Rhizobium leguminosarum TaxID=384 RepID=UPI0011AE4852|nr:hypothetical protein [Rhizobium leguminosarum]
MAFIASPSIILADDEIYSGPFYMCPDAHGADQKALFRIIDITRMPMRIEGRGPQRIDGYAASLAASRTVEMMNKKDPIAEAFEKLAGTTTTMSADKRRLAAVCFATTPPPEGDVDGPFVFMPGYLIESSADVLQPLDTITIPAQTYLVLIYQGPTSGIGDMRFTMTEEFWPKVAPFLGLQRADGPNLMIWAPGLSGSEDQASLEFWTPIEPYSISPRK